MAVGFPKKGETRSGWPGNIADIWGRSPIVRKGSSWFMPVAGLCIFGRTLVCPESGLAVDLPADGSLRYSRAASLPDGAGAEFGNGSHSCTAQGGSVSLGGLGLKLRKIPAFWKEIASLGKRYFAEVPSILGWLRRPAIEPPGSGPLGRPRFIPGQAHRASTLETVCTDEATACV